MIDDIYEQIWECYDRWSDMLVNPRISRRPREITWTGSRGWRFPRLATFDDLASCEQLGEYSFQVARDGGMVRMYYAFGEAEHGLLQANLEFFQPSELAIFGEPSLNVTDVDPGDRDRARYMLRWLRFDFHPAHRRPLIHEACHLHVGGLDSARIPVHCAPTPAQFIEAVMAWFYPQDYLLTTSGRDPRDQELHCSWLRYSGISPSLEVPFPGLHLTI